MHILIGLITIIGVVAIWIWRMRAAADASREIIEAGSDARAALRRFGYRRKAGQHPADSIDDPRLAAAGMMAAVARMDGDLTADQMNALRVESRASFRVDQKEADDIAAYGRWIAGQSQDPGEAGATVVACRPRSRRGGGPCRSRPYARAHRRRRRRGGVRPAARSNRHGAPRAFDAIVGAGCGSINDWSPSVWPRAGRAPRRW